MGELGDVVELVDLLILQYKKRWPIDLYSRFQCLFNVPRWPFQKQTLSLLP
jgi:hypothetical protein